MFKVAHGSEWRAEQPLRMSVPTTPVGREQDALGSCRRAPTSEVDMNDQGLFIATLLDQSSKAYAAGTVLRLQEATGVDQSLIKSLGFNVLVEDTKVRIQHLAEALACGRSELFVLDTQWVAGTYLAREMPTAVLTAMLSCLASELRESLPEGDGAMAAEYVEDGLNAVEGISSAPQTEIEASSPHSELANSFLLSVLEGKRTDAEALIESAVERGISIPDIHQFIISRTQKEIGRLWQVGEVHVAKEHLGSRIVEGVLAQLRLQLPKTPHLGLKVISASVSGNLHDIGLRIVADQFEMHGWDSIFLGANMPAEDIGLAASEFQPDLVALSVGLGINLRAAATSIKELRLALPKVRIIVGGWPFVMIDDLWNDIGADGCASSAREAVTVGTRILGVG